MSLMGARLDVYFSDSVGARLCATTPLHLLAFLILQQRLLLGLLILSFLFVVIVWQREALLSLVEEQLDRLLVGCGSHLMMLEKHLRLRWLEHHTSRALFCWSSLLLHLYLAEAISQVVFRAVVVVRIELRSSKSTPCFLLLLSAVFLGR